jgi:uncharacterized protein YyaL (SSP411 family)
MAARVCLKLYRITEEERYQERAQGILRALQAIAQANPWTQAHLLSVQALALMTPVDLTLVGDPAAAGTRELLQAVYRVFIPERRLLLKNPADSADLEKLAPAARSYNSPDGVPVAYLCHHSTCLPGIREAAELAEELARLNPGAGDSTV